jgi:hypothetical protein
LDDGAEILAALLCCTLLWVQLAEKSSVLMAARSVTHAAVTSR